MLAGSISQQGRSFLATIEAVGFVIVRQGALEEIAEAQNLFEAQNIASAALTASRTGYVGSAK